MKIEKKLALAFLEKDTRAASSLLSESPPDVVAPLLTRCSAATATAAIGFLPAPAAAAVLAALEPERVAEILVQSPVGWAGRILRATDATQIDRLLGSLPINLARSLRQTLEQAPNTAGALMDPIVPTVSTGLSVREARSVLRRHSGPLLSYVYVVDPKHLPVGVLHLRDLLVARPEEVLESLCRSPVVQIRNTKTVDALLALRAWRDFHVLPVVDSQGTLVGVLRHDVMQRLRDEATAEASKRATQSIGMDLAELAWTLAQDLADELAIWSRRSRLPPQTTMQRKRP